MQQSMRDHRGHLRSGKIRRFRERMVLGSMARLAALALMPIIIRQPVAEPAPSAAWLDLPPAPAVSVCVACQAVFLASGTYRHRCRR